jgi:2-polyprenyl-3-methyl-5-hydroxy-6-metoxy-1,4-benzoquinol methylase
MESTSTPTVSPERIMQFAWGYAPPLIIEAAIRNRVFDQLDAGPKTIAETAAATGASERGLRAIMNALVGIGLLTKSADAHYSLTPESATFLVSTKPSYIGGFIRHTSTQILPKWLDLAEIVRGGKSKTQANQESQGTEFFHEFVEDLFPLNYPVTQILAGELGLDHASQPVRVLDIAAGSGVWGIGLARRSPQVRVTALDWSGVLDVTRKVVGRFGLTDRFTFVAGDLNTADFGTGYQVATLGHILHSEGERRSRTLVKKVFESLAPGGTIAVAEFLVNDDRTGPPNGLIFAVNMLMATDAGDTWSFHEIASWLREAGFENARTVDSPGPSPLILATKPK